MHIFYSLAKYCLKDTKKVQAGLMPRKFVLMSSQKTRTKPTSMHVCDAGFMSLFRVKIWPIFLMLVNPLSTYHRYFIHFCPRTYNRLIWNAVMLKIENAKKIWRSKFLINLTWSYSVFQSKTNYYTLFGHQQNIQ